MRKWKTALVFLSTLGLLAACGQTSTNPNPEDPPSGDTDKDGDDKTDSTVHVESVEFEVSELELMVGETELIGHTVLPNNATDKEVIITSSNTSVATIDNNGIIRALSAGQTTLVVTTKDGNKTSEALLTVVPDPDKTPIDTPVVNVTGIKFSSSVITLNEGEKRQTSIQIIPSNATNQSVKYTTEDKTIATISNTGMVQGVKEGSTIVKATTNDGGFVAQCTIKVEKIQEADPDDPEEEEEPLPTINYVQVFAPAEYSTVYAWIGEGASATKLLGEWPGKPLKDYDDTWKTYDFPGYTALNVIFKTDSGSQTADLSIDEAGYYWYYQGELKTEKPDIKIDPYIPPSEIPQGNYDIVEQANAANDLPAVKNYNKGQVINKYNGSRHDFRDESIYFTITTRFYDGDPDNNTKCWDGRNNAANDPAWRGDFKGLIEKMDYIKALGFTAIWITPVVKNASGYDYHGYHAINFKEVDPRYLSQDVSFQTVIDEAHSRDMKIILDVVFNHSGNFGEENLFPMFYYDSANNTTVKGIIRNSESGLLSSSYDSMAGGAQYNTRIETMKGDRDVYNIYHHERSMAYEQYIEQTGQMAGDCVDLNTENPTVANYLVDAYGEFIRMGVDAFRIDTMKHISRLTFNNYIWPGLYAIAEKCGNTDFFMFGEVCTRVREVWNHGQACDSAPFYTWKENKNYAWGTREVNEQSTKENWNDNANTNQRESQNAYLQNGRTYHEPDHSQWSKCSVIDFPMHWNFQNARDAFGVAVGSDKYYNDATYNVVYVDSHDYGPDGAEKIRYNEGTDAWKENMSLMFTFRGVPCIYYGSEIEFQKGKTIDEGPNLALANSGRAYYGDNLEGNVTASDFGVFAASGKVNETLNATLSQHLIKLNKIRLAVPALRRGQYSTDAIQSSGMAFVRCYQNSFACVAISGGATFNNIPNGTYKDMYSGEVVNVGNGSLSTSVSGRGNVKIFVKQ
ncbi:MAG: Ig-like domain-containing protein [Bacilli bacterium]|nr:Ig-like domain-containing protein [Bacilli bacterium]